MPLIIDITTNTATTTTTTTIIIIIIIINELGAQRAARCSESVTLARIRFTAARSKRCNTYRRHM